MDRNKLMQLQQGPEAKLRNYLADMVRQYGMTGLSDRLNSPTSGIGMVVDAVGGLGNALVVQPAQSFNRLLSMGYQSGDPQGAEDAFNVAGAAMLGGIAAPRPRGSIGMSGRPEGAALNAAGERQAMPPSYVSRTNTISDPALLPRLAQDGYDTSRLLHRGTRREEDGFRMDRTSANEVAGIYTSPRERTAQSYGDFVHRGFLRNGRTLAIDSNLQVMDKTIADELAQAGINTNRLHERETVQKLRDLGFTSVDQVGPRGNAWATVALDEGDILPITASQAEEIRTYRPDLFANGGRPGAAVGAAANAAAERPGIRAYHGSPHDFDRFDISRIGTGEGAQAYGHGLYFAENEGVAKDYRNKLAGKPFIEDADAAARYKADMLAWLQSREGNPPQAPDMKQPGKMYEVRINASPDDFLDWDKPLSQQSEKVRGVLSSGVKTYTVKDAKGYDIPLYPFGQQPKGTTPFSTTDRALAERIASERGGIFTEGTMPLPDKSGKEVFGSDLVRTESARTGNGGWFTSDMLREAGIPGIKYLDQGSRTAGEGSRNYVVFDDALVEILRKYGLLGMIGGGAVAAGAEADRKPQSDWASRMRPGDA